MSELKAMLSRVIREGGNFVSRDKAAEALREYTDKEKSFQSRISELEEFKKEALEVIGFYGANKSWGFVNQEIQPYETWAVMDESDTTVHVNEKLPEEIYNLGGKRAREFMAKWDKKEEANG